MKHANLNGLRPWLRNRPVLGRVITFGWLLTLPFVAAGYILYVGCKEAIPDLFEAVGKMLGVIFLPWGDDE